MALATALPALPARRVGPASAVIGRNLLVLRHEWTALAFGVLEPVLYLLSIGVGVGKMVGTVPGLSHDVRYATYVGPALMAMAAMNGTMNATAQAVFLRLRFENTYRIMLATPLRPADVARGEIGTAVLRGTLEGAGFLGVMALFGVVRSPWALLDLPAAVLVGFAFAGIGLAAATYLRDWPDFQMLQLVLLPMFLFATTFYPLSVYPGPIQALVRCLPLYHSINILRELALGQVGTALIAPAVYLAGIGLAGLLFAIRRLDRRLGD
jgi:lipooligosaccharide transport system permease protein